MTNRISCERVVVPSRSTEHILVVEDDPIQSASLRAVLEHCGFSCEIATTGAAALYCFQRRKPDVILADVSLPDCDGFELISIFRRASLVPLIVVSARSSESDKVAALDKGADDYVEKPFHPGELVARIRAKLRLCQEDEPEVPPRELDQEASADLTRMERILLSVLVKNQGATVSEAELINAVWGPYGKATDNDLRVLVMRLRRKLEMQQQPLYILNDHAAGYYVSGWVHFPRRATGIASASRQTPESPRQRLRQVPHSGEADKIQPFRDGAESGPVYTREGRRTSSR